MATLANLIGGVAPAGSAGALSGQPQGPLSGNGGFFDQLWPLAAGAALLAGPSLRQGLANAAGAVVPALQQDRRRTAINAWLKAKSGSGTLDPETLKLLTSDPGLGEGVAASMLAPHPKQLAFDRLARGYVFEPYSGNVQPLQATGAQGVADAGSDAVLPGIGATHVVPMSQLLGRPQKIGMDASGRTVWRDATGQLALGPAGEAEMLRGLYAAAGSRLKAARATLYGLGGLKEGDDPATIDVPDPADPAGDGRSRQWDIATGQIVDAARRLGMLTPDSVYRDAYVPQAGDRPELRAAKVNRLNQLAASLEGASGQAAVAAPPAVPPRPASVPAGYGYDPTSELWSSPDGRQYVDRSGALVAW
jgi:hypothetical protein